MNPNYRRFNFHSPTEKTRFPLPNRSAIANGVILVPDEHFDVSFCGSQGVEGHVHGECILAKLGSRIAFSLSEPAGSKG
jgi:hypothetical protein